MAHLGADKITGTILVVDDYEDNLDVLSRRLERKGYTIVTADSGESALAKVAEMPKVFDLVLLDVMMPGIDGFEVLLQLRSKYSPIQLPVILVTAKDQSDDIVKGLRMGANDYVTKPIDFPVLFARVRSNVQLAASDRSFRGAQKLLIDAAKMESIGYLAAGVAHEVRNPLAQLQMGIDFVKSSVDASSNEHLPAVLETMEDAVVSADKIVKNLMQFSESRRLNRERVNISSLVLTCLKLLEEELDSQKIQVSVEADEICPANVDVAQIETAIVNVITNAIQAMPQGGLLTVRTKLGTVGSHEVLLDEGSRSGNELRAGDEAVVLEIADTGTGIPDKNLSTVFDAFYTSNATGQGSGLGLTVAKKIIDLHDGKLKVENRSERQGVLVTFLLPSKVEIVTSV